MSNAEPNSWAGFFEDLQIDAQAEETFWTEEFTAYSMEDQDMILMEYESWKLATGPKTDDELHQLILAKFNLNIPRAAVCKDLGHKAPFSLLADLYFERTLSAFAMANRGGSKTFIAALWLFLCDKYKPGTEGASVASEQQTMRAYEHLKKIICMDGGVDIAEHHPDITSSVMRKTTWANGSLYEIIIATMSGTSGPHPQKVHTDEVEHIDPPVFENSRNMSAPGKGIMSQDLLTSTRYRAHGPVQAIWDECDESIQNGYDPPYDRYTWCVFECVERQDNCMVAFPDHPHPCGCDKVVKGEWESGEPRRFSDICQGRCARADGFLPLQAVWKNFRTLTRGTWETQQECIKPATEGLVLPEFDRTRHGIRAYRPDPKNGPIYGSVDFGGTNPHAVVFIQQLKQDVLVHGFHQTGDDDPKVLLRAGTRVVFDEIYLAEIAPSKLADLVIERYAYWRRLFSTWRVHKFFYDYQAKGAFLEWARHTPPIPLCYYATKDVRDHINIWHDLFEENQFYVNVSRCPNLCNEIEAWRYPDQKTFSVDNPDVPVKDFDHAVDATRYTLANIRVLDRERDKRGRGGAPSADDTGHVTANPQALAGPPRYREAPQPPTPRGDPWAPVPPR